MPNWCYTQIVFHGNYNEITDFHQKITEYTSKNLIPNGFGSPWLGNVLGGVGLKDRIDHPDPVLRIRCRGSMNYISDVETFPGSATFYIDTETAWAPMVQMWVEVIKALKYETVKFSFIAEEPNMEIYEIYDPCGDYVEKYYVDIWLGDEDENNEAFDILLANRYYDSDEALKEALQKLLDTHGEGLKVLIDKAEKYDFKDEDSYIRIHEFTRLENFDDYI